MATKKVTKKKHGGISGKPYIMRSELEEDLIILKAKIKLSEKVRDEKIFGEAWFSAHTYVTYLLGQKCMLESIMARFP